MTSSPELHGHPLREAARHAGVVWAGLYVLGIGFGVVVTGQGWPWWLAPITSATVFAGSAEFVLIGLLTGGASLVTIAVTTFLINARHAFYGLSFPLSRVRGRLARAWSIFALIDEAFALLAPRDPRTLSSGEILWTQVGLWVSWGSGAATGGLVGETFLSGVKGLDFVLTALFIVLTMDAYRDRPSPRVLAFAVGSAALAIALFPGSMLLVSMILFTALLAGSYLVRHRGEAGGHVQETPDA